MIVIPTIAASQNADVFPPDSIKQTIAAVRIDAQLRIDGVLNEPEWSLAKPSPHFTQVEPHQGAPSDFETTVRVLYNKQFLYVGVFSQDPAGKKAIRATDFRRDFDYLAHDLVTLTFDGFNDRRNAMCFATNAYGVQRDYLAFDDLYFDIDWDGLWRVRTTRTDSGWYAEIAIPWQTLRYPKTGDSLQSWGFNVYRNRRLTNEISAFSPFPRVFGASRMEYAGRLTGLEPPPPKPNVRIQPYLLTETDRSTGTPAHSTAKLGGDLKWAINSSDVLDLTANTDFAQADADLQVNNVSQFSVFFPERRQFFLENASLFSPAIQQAGDGSGGLMHIQPFFSRTIGLDAAGNPIPIVAGARFVRRGSGSNYGALLMRQEARGASPAVNLFVGRYSGNVGLRSRIGGLVTVKNSDAGSNVTSTLDGLIRLSEAQSLNTIFSHTVTTGTNTQGLAAFAQYYNSTTHYKMWFTQSLATRDYDPQMGFISRTDVIGTTPGMNWYYRGRLLPFKNVLRAFEPGFLPEWYWQASSGKFIERSLYFWPVWLNFQSGAYFGYSITPVYQNLTQPFQPLGVTIAPGEYRYAQSWITFTTDPSRMIRLYGDYKWGGFYNGRLQSGDWRLQFAPIPHISVIAELNRNHFVDVGASRTTSTVDLRIIQGRFALNPHLQLTGFYQNNSLDHSDSYNVRFSWEYLPLSYLYVIYNHGKSETLLGSHSDQHAIVKISVLKQL
ncbi:MAG TPA: DUF5916 domain-containing protein [Gemmatimonadales bacterium]|nr:DUF5916 domain-containing protein [Gemmatimonadales bacterium]